MGFSFSLAESFSEVPASVLVYLRELLRGMLDDLETLPKDNAVLELLAENGLHIDFFGWRFEYRINRDTKQVVVQSATKIP